MDESTWKHITRYEFTLASGFGLWPFLVLKTTLQTFYHANIDHLRNWQTFLIVSGFISMIYCTADACYNYLWINILGFFPPIPFGGYTVGSICFPVIHATLWFRMSKKARKEKELKRRFVIFLVSQVYDIFIAWVYALTTLLFILIPLDYQPILGLVCPFIREILLRSLNFITYRAGGGRRVKMGKYFHNTASGSEAYISIPCEIKNVNSS